MPTNLTVNGIIYPYPITDDDAWGSIATNWAIAISSEVLYKTGGNFTLTKDVNFGSSFGLKAAYIAGRASNTAQTGFIRLSSNQYMVWRNNANTGNLALGIDGSDTLTYNNLPVVSLNVYPILKDTTTGLISHANSGLTVATYGSGNSIPVITVDTFGHITGISTVTIDVATAHAAFDQANAAFDKANTANVTGQAAFDQANGAIYTAAQIRANISNTAPINYAPSTGIISHADSGASVGTYGNTTFTPTITVDAKGHITSIVNTAIALPPSSDQFARDQANAAYNKANGSVQTGFVTLNVAGQSNVVADSNTDTLTLVGGTGIAIVTDAANDTITFSATGTATSIDQYARDKANGAAQQSFVTLNVAGQSDVVADSNTDTLTIIAGQSMVITTDAANDTITFSSTATGGGANSFATFNVAGQSDVVADSNNDTLTLVAGTGVVLTTNAITDTITFSSSDAFASQQANAAFDKANADFTLATTANTVAAAAYAQANAAYANANTAIYTAAQIRANISNTLPIGYSSATGVINLPSTANGQIHIGNTVSGTFDITTIAQTAPVIVTNGKGTVTLSHASSGVASAGYGDSATVPKVVVDTFGHVTSVTNTDIAISAAAVTSGTLVVARGGTGQTAITVNGSLLIGNTVSGGFDVNALTAGAGMTVTNDKGIITLSSTGNTNVTNVAGNIFTTSVNVTGTLNGNVIVNAINSSQVLLNFGAVGTDYSSNTITNSLVTATSIITGSIAYAATPGTFNAAKDQDEFEMDRFNVIFSPAQGSFTVYVTCDTGLFLGEAYLNYSFY